MESLKIGDWQGELPSVLCGDAQAITSILSLDTWNNVLNPSQRLRLMQFLPEGDPDPLETIRQLLTGSLKSFSSCPIQSFISHLQGGHFDPTVVEVKASITRARRRASLRALKSYHLQLLQDIVVSRHNLLSNIRKRKAPSPLPPPNIPILLPPPRSPPHESLAKGSPILASQLQTPSLLLSSPPSTQWNPHPPSPLILPSFHSSSSAMDLDKSSGDDELESSSDEFIDTINPTIGFETSKTPSPLPPMDSEMLSSSSSLMSFPPPPAVTSSGLPTGQVFIIGGTGFTKHVFVQSPCGTKLLRVVDPNPAPLPVPVPPPPPPDPPTSSLPSMTCMDSLVAVDSPSKAADVVDLFGDASTSGLFDSIPNLSDELDSLDLDLMESLTDFEGLLSEERNYACFFSLLRDVLCSTRDHRMTFAVLERTVRRWAGSTSAATNAWFTCLPDWSEALLTALNFLAGNYAEVQPEEFVPYIEYKFKTKYYQWIGAGRDGDNNLTPLCAQWIASLPALPHLRKEGDPLEEPDEDESDGEEGDTSSPAGDDGRGCGGIEGGNGGSSSSSKVTKRHKRPVTPPPPRFVTDWSVRPSTQQEKAEFREQERGRFESPHRAWTYRVHGYESIVGPVKGVYSSQAGLTNKARGHSLLVDDRPPYVTILALVRDAVARLPNGEGTRSDICELLRDSAFLAPDASSATLNSVVSGALDRLHYERDPCVRYDSHKKSWIYLHRDRTQDQFERLHHNRSYTKSTKSRSGGSGGGRKVRKVVTTEPSAASEPHSEPPPQAPPVVSPSPTLSTSEISPVIQTPAPAPAATFITSLAAPSTSLSSSSTTPPATSSSVTSNPLPQQTFILQTSKPLIGGGPDAPKTTQHFVLGPQAMLRLATALRFGGGRLPGTSSASTTGSPPRLPQGARILLTRSSGPSQPINHPPHGQLLLGQMANGQTVLLTSGGGPGGPQQRTFVLQTTQGSSSLGEEIPGTSSNNTQTPILIRSPTGGFIIPGNLSLLGGARGQLGNATAAAIKLVPFNNCPTGQPTTHLPSTSSGESSTSTSTPP